MPDSAGRVGPVSILVLLDDAHREHARVLADRHGSVSILVLLDDAHRGPGRLGIAARYLLVSILVLLDDAHRVDRVTAAGRIVELFQSLFFWMTLIGFR